MNPHTNTEPLDELISEYLIDEIARETRAVARSVITPDFRSSLSQARRDGTDVATGLAFDPGSELVIVGQPPDRPYKIVDADVGADFFRTHDLYQVPIFFDPFLMLSGRDQFSSLDEWLKKVKPKDVRRIELWDDHRRDRWEMAWDKLTNYTPRDWLENAQMLKTLLQCLDVVCRHLYYAYCNDGDPVTKFTEIPAKTIRKKLNRARTRKGENRVMNSDAMLVLADLDVLHLNQSFSNGNRTKEKWNKSFRMHRNHPLPLYKHLAIERGRGHRKLKPDAVIWPHHEFIKDNISRLTIDPLEWERLKTKLADNPDRIFGSVEARRRMVVDNRLTRGKKGNRAYHALTNAPRELRSCLRLDGQMLVDLDIAQAQPTFLLSLLLKSGQCSASDLDYYRELLDGDIYTTLYGRGEITRAERDDAKIMFSAYAYSGKRRWSPIAKSIRERMPTIGELIDGGSRAAELQRLEARVIVDGVIRDLMVRDLFCVPIHDGIICLPKDADSVGGLICQHFRKVTGLEARVERKMLTLAE